MQLKSPAFSQNGVVPAKYTCDGQNINPPLQIAETPETTKSLVLICDDPDAPAKTWVHWTAWNIGPETTEVAEGQVPNGAVQGLTDFGEVGYGGPCPPTGTHRYFFKLYALDTNLALPYQAKKEDLEKAMEGHVIDETQLVGVYSRKG